jgi:Ca2+-binding RTX toxin-like protein
MATILGTAGNDQIDLDNANAGDIVYALEGNDTVMSSADGVELFGQAGRDVLDVSFATTSATVMYGWAELDGGDGNDTLKFEAEGTATGSSDPDDSYLGIGSYHKGGAGDDNISAAITISADEPAYYPYYLYAGPMFEGGDGDDTVMTDVEVSCADQNDYGEAGTHVDGGAGNDVINSRVSADNGSATSYLYGGDGNDELIAKTYGTAVSEDVAPASVYNILDGGNGNDHIVSEGTISEIPSEEYYGLVFEHYISGGIGADTIEVSQSLAGVGGELQELPNIDGFLYIMGDAGRDTIAVSISSTVPTFLGLYYSEISGGEDNDRIHVDLDNIKGSLGINGDSGDDTLSGASSLITDEQFSFNGGPGSDVMSASAGHDTFVINGPEVFDRVNDRDVIIGFDTANDLILLPDGFGYVDRIQWKGPDTVIALQGSGDTIRLEGVHLTEADYGIFV